MAFKTHIDNSTGNQPGTISPIETAVLSEGVHDLARGDFLVSGKASLAVDIAKGEAFIQNDSYVYGSMDQKMFAMASSATETVAVTSNSSGNPRIDIVCIKIDTAASPGVQGVGSSSIVVIAGTPAATPSAPAVPSNHLKIAQIAVANGASTTSGQVTDTRPQAIVGAVAGPEGFLVNGQIVRTVASNNITLAIKTLAGNDPSTGEPVWVRLGGNLRKITSALSVTKNAGTNWMNSGSSELATREVDYFVYLAWDVADNTVRIGFARFCDATLYSDFSATTTNVRYGAFDTNPDSTDQVQVVGRFNAILSATSAFNWSVPGTSIIIQRPIYETRDLIYSAQIVSGWSSLSTNVVRYKITGNQLFLCGIVDGTSNATSAVITVPFASKTITSMEWGGTNIYATDNGGVVTAATKSNLASNATSLNFYKDMGISATSWTASGAKQIRFAFTYLI